mmetsp:Transcript_29007/g.94778  ORF Transcript_29007/g.94778 Transcript_29007/m.94778 type:complete len:122 (+) Transcript_29007:37-402(+)
MTFPVKKSDSDWRKQLNQKEFNILRRAATEPAGTGEYNRFFPQKGHFACRGCGFPLYAASSKFQDSGWIAFDRTLHDRQKGLCHVGVRPDAGGVEIICNSCGSHLGHVFYGESHTCTNERH